MVSWRGNTGALACFALRAGAGERSLRLLQSLKSLFVVLVLALPAFALARPVCLRYMSAADFDRRRNLWLVLTAAAFLSPDFWLFAALAIPMVYFGAARDAHPVALYLLLLHVVPPGVGAELPTFGINRLFGITGYRILAFAILIPLAWRLASSPRGRRGGRLSGVEWGLLAYGALLLALFMPYESFTNTLRRGFLFWLDIVLPVWVIYRSCRDRAAIEDAIACYALAIAVLVPVALFESLKSWLLYDSIAQNWEQVGPISAYLFRESTLRAQASFGHAITFGYGCAVALGLWLCLGGQVRTGRSALPGVLVFAVGMLAAYSRSPWLTAAVIGVAWSAMTPRGGVRLLRLAAIAVPVGALLLVSPAGERIVDNLPFVGSVDAVNVTYRQLLAEKAWEQILEHPFFGNAFALYELEELRQGQGIIDLVNTYASVGIFYGLVGLALFLAPMLLAMLAVRRAMRAADAQARQLGAGLLACAIGTLFMMATASFGNLLEKTYYLLIALQAAYALRLPIAARAGSSSRAGAPAAVPGST